MFLRAVPTHLQDYMVDEPITLQSVLTKNLWETKENYENFSQYTK